MLKKSISFLLILLTGLSACTANPDTKKYGLDYNSDRQKLGLPIIPNNWTLDQTNEVRWYNPEWQEKRKKHIPVHASKYLTIRASQLISEEDEYYGPGEWNCEGGICPEELLIDYCYQPDSPCTDKSGQDQSGWSILYQSQESMDKMTYNKVTVDGAKKILESWGLTYP
jgi:hypothetical protein